MKNTHINFKKVEELFPHVLKPARYIGGEINSVTKDPSKTTLRVCLLFPDVYEIGMSNLGIDILYSTINKVDNYWAERAFTPWKDFGEKLKENNIPLYSLESKTPLNEFDIIAVSLQYERLYTNFLYSLELANIPLTRQERNDSHPLIIAGGPSTINPEPMSDFVDLFHVGEGDESIIEILNTYKKDQAKQININRLSELDYIYNPQNVNFEFNQDGTIKKATGKKTKKKIYYDFAKNKTNYSFIIPNIQPHQDKGTLQIARGCINGCRFCQAGMTDRPLRERPIDLIKSEAEDLINKTGVKELSFNSLSISDYSKFPILVDEIMHFQNRGINIGLPSLKVESYNLNLAKRISNIRKTSLTFAIEVGNEDGFLVINKNINEEKLISIVESVIDAGWRNIKFYFMLGLPFIDNEVESIITLLNKIALIGREHHLRDFITASVNAFVPKPHTPFQWVGMESIASINEKMDILRRNLNRKYITLKWNKTELNFIEAALARGDRRLGKVILNAYKNGAIFDGWDEEFKFNTWVEAFKSENLDAATFAQRTFAETDILPWEMVDIYVTKKHLFKEFEKARNKLSTKACNETCIGCGDFPKKCEFPEKIEALTEPQVDRIFNKPAETKTPFKYTLLHTRTGLLRFVGHLDFIALLDKILRMSKLPVCYTQGFNSHTKLTFSDPNPIGVESFCDFLKFELTQDTDLMKIKNILEPLLPKEVKILDIVKNIDPIKQFKSVSYEVSPKFNKIPTPTISFQYSIDENSDSMSITLPYPQPLGILRFLEAVTGQPREKVLNFNIKKNKLS